MILFSNDDLTTAGSTWKFFATNLVKLLGVLFRKFSGLFKSFQDLNNRLSVALYELFRYDQTGVIVVWRDLLTQTYDHSQTFVGQKRSMGLKGARRYRSILRGTRSSELRLQPPL